MLWQAGQKRLAREGRERLTELFVAARDAGLDVLVSTGQAKPKGAWRLPPYARPESTPSVRNPAVRDATLAKLGMMFPGMVRRGDS
jgi:hypothetical protein